MLGRRAHEGERQHGGLVRAPRRDCTRITIPAARAAARLHQAVGRKELSGRYAPRGERASAQLLECSLDEFLSSVRGVRTGAAGCRLQTLACVCRRDYPCEAMDDTPPTLPRARRSASADAARAAELERIRRMTVLQRVAMALDLGKRSRVLSQRRLGTP